MRNETSTKWLWIAFCLGAWSTCATMVPSCQSPENKWLSKTQERRGPVSARRDQAEILIIQATERRRTGKLDKARDLLLEAVRLDPSSGRANHDLGLVYHQLGDAYNAAIRFQTAAKLLPVRPEPRFNLAQMLEAGGKYEHAIKEYANALRQRPGDPAIRTSLVRARVKAGLIDQETLALIEGCLETERRTEWVDFLQRHRARIARNLAATNRLDESGEPSPQGRDGVAQPASEMPDSPVSLDSAARRDRASEALRKTQQDEDPASGERSH